ncbi:MAG: hypothetical protein SF029_10355 [bacterium]|nr:hypothetical protein [bacterium]
MTTALVPLLTAWVVLSVPISLIAGHLISEKRYYAARMHIRK